jgi:hypothetical protein
MEATLLQTLGGNRTQKDNVGAKLFSAAVFSSIYV